MMKRFQAFLAVLTLALTGLFFTAAPASAHNSAAQCWKVNHFHTLQPDIYYIGQAWYTRNGRYGLWRKYVHDPIIGSSFTTYSLCG